MDVINLRNMRRSKGWSQKQFADKIGITEAYYNSIECGRLKAGLKTLVKIAKIFKIEVFELLN